MSNKAPKQTARVNFKLAGAHTHRGKGCDEGDTINIPRSVAKRMESEKKGSIVNASASSQASEAEGKQA